MTSKTAQSSAAPWMNKAQSALAAVGQGIAIAKGVRQAAPVVMGVLRTAGSLLPFVP